MASQHPQASLGVEDPGVTGVQPAAVDHARGTAALVTVHQSRPGHEHLAVVGDPHLGTGQGVADGAAAGVTRYGERDDAPGLGAPVALEQGDAGEVVVVPVSESRSAVTTNRSRPPNASRTSESTFLSSDR